MGSVTPARYADCALSSPPGPSKAPSPMVFPLLLPIVSESPGPGESVSSRIQGRPILFTGVSTASAAGSGIVGGTGMTDSRLGGREGLTTWMDDTGTRLPVVAGIGVFPPPLPLPSAGLRPRITFRRSPGTRTSPPGSPRRMGLGFGLRGWTAASTSAAIMTACVSREALWARPDRGDLCQSSACSGAPLADQGKIRAGENACLKFSSMR